MEWISVKDELPADGIDVLCIWEHGYWSGDTPRMSVDRIQNQGSGVRNFQGNYIHCYTHWKVLPPPPSSSNSEYMAALEDIITEGVENEYAVQEIVLAVQRLNQRS